MAFNYFDSIRKQDSPDPSLNVHNDIICFACTAAELLVQWMSKRAYLTSLVTKAW